MKKKVDKKRTGEISVEVRRWEGSETKWVALVTTHRGYLYFRVWAGDKPDVSTVKKSWQAEGDLFAAFDFTKVSAAVK